MFQWSTRSMAQHAVPRIPRSWPPTITTNSRWFNRPQDFAGGMTSFATVLPCTCIILLWVVGQLRFVTTCLGISVSKSMIMISITRYVIYTYIYIYMCVCLCHTLYITYWMLFVITDMWYTLVVVCLCNILCLLYTKHIHWTYCIFTSFLNNIYRYLSKNRETTKTVVALWKFKNSKAAKTPKMVFVLRKFKNLKTAKTPKRWLLSKKIKI